MAQAKKHILPFFIPHLGCPQQCIFCDQHKIAGQAAPTAGAVCQAILALPAAQRQDYELAFYGGSFTALPVERQEYYLEPVRQALTAGLLGAARISTRPDCLDEVVLARLRHFGVGTVELGVQSMDDEVLRLARRGHTAQQSLAAVRRLQRAGFVVGVQLMPGLPGETLASAWAGAQRVLAEQPQLLRIYPTVVLQGTALGRLWQQGEYQPLSLEQAAQITLAIKLLAEEQGTAVIRMVCVLWPLCTTSKAANRVFRGIPTVIFEEVRSCFSRSWERAVNDRLHRRARVFVCGAPRGFPRGFSYARGRGLPLPYHLRFSYFILTCE